MTELSVVVPVYNEESSIEQLVLDLEREVVPLAAGVEVIVVDDASTDGTAAILAGLADGRPWLRVRRAERNAGHGPAVVRGLEEAAGEWIFQLDSDGQFVVAEIDRLWNRRDDADLVLGVRAERHDPGHRLALSRVVRLVVSALVGKRLRDANVPFRLFRAELWRDVGPFLPRPALAPSIFVTLGAVSRGWRIVEVPVTHLRGTREVSTLRKWRLVKFSLAGLRDLVAYRYKLARHGRAPALVARDTA
jgi:dolichol-phosphate mannosyltransferase